MNKLATFSAFFLQKLYKSPSSNPVVTTISLGNLERVDSKYVFAKIMVDEIVKNKSK